MRPQFGEVARTRFLCEGGAREEFFSSHIFLSCLFHLYSIDQSYTVILHFYTNFMIALTLNWFSKGKRENHTCWLHWIFQYFLHAPQCILLSFLPLETQRLLTQTQRWATLVADGDLQGFHHVSERKSSLSLWFEMF